MNYRAEALLEETLPVEEGTVDQSSKSSNENPARSEPLSTEEIEELILENRESARKLAHSLLRRWRVIMPLDEIESIVDLTLCEAASRYSPNHGASFMTFSFYYMRGNLARTIGKLAKISQLFVAPGPEALDLSISPSVQNATNAAYVMTPDHALIHDFEQDAPERVVMRLEQIDLCRKALNRLDDLEKEVLHRLYAEEETLVEIARRLGYSRCHISRVKKRALKQLEASYQDISGTPERPAILDNPHRENASPVERKKRGRRRRGLSMQLAAKKRFTSEYRRA